MYKVSCEIKGIAPYFFSRPTQDKTPKGEAQEKKVALNRVYCNGHLHIPARQIKGTLLGAVTLMNMKIERSRLRATNLIMASLWVRPDEIFFKPEMNMDDVQLDKFHTMLDNGKMRWNYQAFIGLGKGDWGLKFEMTFPEFLEPDFVKEALENAGAYCGCGGRRNHGNGRFEVVEFILS